MVDELDLFQHYKPDNSQIMGLQGILAGVLGVKDDGIFVEVGANNGLAYSNTYHLTKIGWQGVYIEPIPYLYQRLLMLHNGNPKIKVVNAFMSSEAGEVDMYEYNESYSGNPAWLEKFGGKFVTRASKKTLDSVLDVLDMDPEFDLLVIDAEAHDYEVLKGSRIDYWHPKMVIIEACEYHADEMLRAHAISINDYMHDNWYEKIYADTINSIFVLGLP